MRPIASVLFFLSVATPAVAAEQTKQLQAAVPVLNAFLACGERQAAFYAEKLSSEPASDIAIAARQKCTSEREAAVQAIQGNFPASNWKAFEQLIDERFHGMAITKVMDTRAQGQ